MDSLDVEGPLEALLASYVVLRERGVRDPLDALCASHPHLADALRSRAAELDRIRAHLSQMRASDEMRPWGHFTLLREIGRGGMGVVYLARDERVNREIALKALASPTLAGGERFARFEREVRAIAKLNHPAIVPLYECGEHEGVPFYTMEYVEGHTLAALVESLRDRGIAPVEIGPSDWDEERNPISRSHVERVCRCIAEIADALDHAHRRGVLHRDVKPSNILVRRDDGRALLFDFGLARVDERATLTVSGELLGTPYYASPEQVSEGHEIVDARTDIYSLGVTLYELLTLRVPFTGATTHQILRRIRTREPEPPRRRNPSVPRDLERICLTAMEKDPGRRYGCAREMKEDLERFLAFRPVQARPIGVFTRACRLVRRNPAVSTAITLAVFLVLGGPLVFGIQNKLARDRLELEKLRTEKQRDLAGDRAVLAQAQRERAMRHLRRAQDAADRFLADVGEVRLAGVPQMEDVRRQLLEEALLFYEELAVEEPDDPEVQVGTAQAFIRVGDIQGELGHLELALEAHTRARTILEGILQEGHAETATCVALARAIAGQAEACFDLSRPQDAERYYREAIETVVSHGGTEPEDPYLRIPLVIAYRQLGALLAGMSRLAEAETALREAARNQQALVEAFPDRPEVRHVQATVLMQTGSILSNSGRPDAAESEYRKALRLLEDLSQSVPTEPVYALDLSTSYSRIGTIAGRLGRIEEARDLFSNAVALLDDLASSHPSIPHYRANLARDLRNLGQAYELLDQPDEAEQAYRRALDLSDAIVRSPTGGADALDGFANDSQAFASFLITENRLDEAEAVLVGALEALEESRRNNTNAGGEYELLRLRRSLADLLKARQRFPEAIEAYRAVVSGWEEMVVRNPKQVESLIELGGVTHNLAMLLQSHGDIEEARRLVGEAVARQEDALALVPQHPRARHFLRNHLHLLVEIHLSRDRPLEALPPAERLLELEGEPWQLVVLARVHARCASMFAGSTNETGDADAHARAALDALGRAFEAGAVSLTELDGSDFESLRGRDEFRRLRERLAAQDDR